jgi:2-polyprenyl-3-methyl-5-hydroxy-6-metoxy-1,4-benzoquinol methylase
MGTGHRVSQDHRANRAAQASRIKYDTAYTAKKDFVARPNAFLKQCLARIAGDRRSRSSSRRRLRALDIGLGQGRNAILLAQRGYDTTGIDRSEVGIRDARRLAAARGLRINAVVADTETYDYGRNRWDLIVLLYYPQPTILIDRLKAAVRPGGYIIAERFSRPKGNNPLDKREAKAPSPMLSCFADWHVLHYASDEFESDWHWNGEAPRGPIVRVLARKPARK